MRLRAEIAAAVLCVGMCPPVLCAELPDFEAAAREAVGLLQAYLRVDTTNPPGRERLAADFFKGILDREGVENRIYDLGNERANILARLPGSGLGRPILLLNHLDVVPADAERWTVPPFSGDIRDGYIWGRGATDMKGTAITQLMTLLLLKRSGVVLDRDVIFLGTADEEEGKDNGVADMVQNHRADLRDAEYCLTEGNTISVEDGRMVSWDVDVTEKAPLWLKLVAAGKAGHASIPEPDGAVARLIRALSKVLAYEPPVRLIPAVNNYFRALAPTTKGELARALSDPSAALRDPSLRKILLENPERSADLRTTISVTGLSGSEKINVIPGEATASIDCRLLPGEDPQRFLAKLRDVADDDTLRWEVLLSETATESPIDTALFRAIERARDRFAPGVPVLTPPLTSSTDATRLRQVGVVVYGFEPFQLSEDDDRSHGDDERLSVDNVRFGLEVTYAVVSDVARSQTSR
ncbi:MAG TPA: M20/M25/M40 family metallo-hydrolase [Thermoanaerobaculia bacterium]|jgi:acetylornithine deacetylase/succinyl-diaminopimelate desuccinylase-like protein|nr:M20/M25/M40 family metallo-hydrolase [Thermoanaerobaculia bacterium]